MRRRLRLYWIAFRNTLASRMAYRIDFFISAVIMLVFEMIIPFATFLIYRSGARIAGWDLHEVLLIQAVFLLAKGVTFPFFAGIVWNTILQIREGTYDLLLIKPRNVLFMTLLSGIDVEDLGKLFGGLGLFIYAVTQIPPPAAVGWLAFALLFLSAVTVFMSFSFLMAGSGFKWVGNFRVYEIFESMTAFAMYPVGIFSKGVQVLITAVIPLALMGFFPAQALLGRFPAELFISLGAAVFFLCVSILFWYRMLRSYT
ncbi:MAG TPA: multidrug ABC transporter permease, partial [Spirochaetia bacterium]|nr:multidrug ABC transporter permease [Spirochaetia bacterium]